MKRIIITIVVIVVALVGAAFILMNNKAEMQEQTQLAKKVNATIPVEVAVVKLDTVGGSFTATGSFAPSRQGVVVTEVAGKVIRLLVDEGQYVKQGQLLARIEYATLEADMHSADANVKKLATDKERYEKLVKSGGVTQAQLDEINLAYVNAGARAVAAKKKFNDTFITAPFGGFVNKRFVEQNTYIGAGKELFEIVDMDKLAMIVNVSEGQVLSVSDAENITVTADVYPATTYPAKVKFISAKADPNLNFPVELEITNIKNKPLRAGMYGRATFGISGGRTAMLIPRAALVGSISNAQVYALKGEAVTLRKIVVGNQFGDDVEVVEGLSTGEEVVINGQINLSEGSRVSVLNK